MHVETPARGARDLLLRFMDHCPKYTRVRAGVGWRERHETGRRVVGWTEKACEASRQTYRALAPAGEREKFPLGRKEARVGWYGRVGRWGARGRGGAVLSVHLSAW